MRALCVGRHQFLSDHLCSYFREAGCDTRAAVGLEHAIEGARDFAPDVVVCDYDLLISAPLEPLERDEVLSRVPIVAVSLTRRPSEVHLLDSNGIGGFLYLPTIDRETVLRVIGAAVRPPRVTYSPITAPRAAPSPTG